MILSSKKDTPVCVIETENIFPQWVFKQLWDELCGVLKLFCDSHAAITDQIYISNFIGD